MHLQPTAGAAAPEAPMGGAGQVPVDLFYDHMEYTGIGNWGVDAITGTNTWRYSSFPYGSHNGPYAPSGRVTLDVNYWGAISDHTATRTAATVIPTGRPTYLRFTHAHAFETGPTGNLDGGVVEIS